MAWDFLNTIGFRGCAKTRQARKYLLYMGFFTCFKMTKVEFSRHAGLLRQHAHTGVWTTGVWAVKVGAQETPVRAFYSLPRRP